ncbi:MAG TPA: response regulator, partial [Phycisphaerae bacterium]|nr:response regulator [Phycisphaerae bacterium]
AETFPVVADADARLGGTETILVVEDDPTVRHLIVEVLRRSGYSVLEAGCADEALPLGNHYQHDIHLLVSDVVMPGLQGPDLARRLRAVRPAMRILFVTGYAENAAIADRNLPTDAALLTKPFGPAEVLRAVRRLLDRKPAR